MHIHTAVVVTSIAAPNAVLRELAEGARLHSAALYVIGDAPSPPDFQLTGADFYSLQRQRETGLGYARLCPERHYARKNIGYLLAIRQGARLIIETDDDNHPLPEFWTERSRRRTAALATTPGWLNVYRYFSDENIWPRGFPLDAVAGSPAPYNELHRAVDIDAPIQQGLADDNPDVDAIYRLVLPLPLRFSQGRSVALGRGVWCPFNSQNTTWWAEAFPLLYLPAHCSFRMTDIWRSFVAQRIAWANGWSLLFHSPTVSQERNDHNLMRDFEDEVVGYVNNRKLCDQLAALTLNTGASAMPDNLRACYEVFIRHGVIACAEFDLIEAWIADLEEMNAVAA